MNSIESSVLNHIFAIEKRQKGTTEKCAAHTSVEEMLIKFWKSRASWEELLEHEDYGFDRKIATNHQWCTNAMNNQPCVPQLKRKFSASIKSSGKKMMLRLKHKSVEWIMDLLSRLCKEIMMVVPTCADTSAIAQAPLQLSENR